MCLCGIRLEMLTRDKAIVAIQMKKLTLLG